MVPFCPALEATQFSSRGPATLGRGVRLAAGAVLLWLAVLGAGADELPTAVHRWLEAQQSVQRWQAEVVQTRDLKSLAQPLVATGKVWFASPNRFRWELGNPAQTIAVRTEKELVVVYPRLKRAERYPLEGGASGAWRDALTLLEAGFPRSAEELQSQFEVVKSVRRDSVHELTLQPRSSSARKLIPVIRITFSEDDLSLQSTELEFADGSRMRNEFRHAQLNLEFPPDLFAPPIQPGFRILEPLKQ